MIFFVYFVESSTLLLWHVHPCNFSTSIQKAFKMLNFLILKSSYFFQRNSNEAQIRFRKSSLMNNFKIRLLRLASLLEDGRKPGQGSLLSSQNSEQIHPGVYCRVSR